MKVTFKNNLGYKLVADFFAAGPDAPMVVFSHGLRSGRTSPRSVPLARELFEENISSFLLDFTGHGDSEGTVEESTTDQQALDLKAAFDYLRAKGVKKFGLSGASFGGASALMAAANESGIKAVVLRYSTMRACFSFKRPCYELAQKIKAPTLLLVGEYDHPILEENQKFLEMLKVPKKLEIIPKAYHAFEEPDQIELATKLSFEWFKKYLKE